MQEVPETSQAGGRFQLLGNVFQVGILGGLPHRQAEAVRSLPAPPFFLRLGEIAAPRIVYVSCNPTTLATPISGVSAMRRGPNAVRSTSAAML